MKKITASLIVALCMLGTGITSSFAQLVGGSGPGAFIQGRYLEIGMTDYGAFGASPAPAGYHPYPAGSALGEVYDLGHDGWTVGTPSYMGDYTYPGSPYEGWGIQAGGTSGLNWAFLSNGAITGPGSLTGHNVAYSNTGGRATATWAGTTAGGQLAVNMQTSIDTNASWVVVKVTLNNTGTAPLPGVYYFRGCDPDNDEAHGGSFSTNNIISYQNDILHRVLVSSNGTTYTSAYMGLGTKDSRAKSMITTSWPVDFSFSDLAALYAGTTGVTYGLGTTSSGDVAIGLVFNLGTIAAGDSALFSYAYIFNGISGIDSAFPSWCTGTPVAGAVISNSLLACTTTTVTLTDTGSTALASYQWQSSPDSVAWSNIAGATSVSYALSGMTATTYYRMIATCLYGGASDTTAGIKIAYTAACPCILVSAGTVTSSVPYACTTATITLTDSGFAASAATLHWQSSPDSTTWSDIPGATSGVYSFTGLTTTTFYRANVVCTSGGGSIASVGVKVPYHSVCICVGTPDAGTATASTTSCSSCSLTLNLSGATAADSLRYQWQRSADGFSWTNISGGITVPYTFTPYGTYYYRCLVTCVHSGLSDTSSVVEVFYAYHIISHSVTNAPDTACSGSDFHIQVNGVSPLLYVKTYYGDGSTDSVALASAFSTASATVAHVYSWPGNYSIKQVIYWHNVPQDSITFSYEYYYCRTLPLKFYFDVNGDCAKESTEPYNNIPLLVKIDSNGIPVDTLSASAGIYYKALGLPGTVYSFTVMSSVLYASCPVSGVIYDTIISTVNTYPVKNVGLSCTGSSAFDLTESTSMICGRHATAGNVLVSNLYCTPENATVTVNFSPKYVFAGAHPTPTTHTSNSITWDLSALSSLTSPTPFLEFSLNHSGVYLIVGDTVNSDYTVTPITGDANPGNNMVIRDDTVKSSFDPNYIEVSPSGHILAGTQLQYTIHFENTGNDTAHNIYVMDTLSDNLDAHSLQIVGASATMNVAYPNDGTNNMVKFDFPAINLLDSSHHNECDGMLVFTINSKSGLPDGTTIFNHGGIFFDDNPVVMTDTVENIIGIPTTSISNTQPAIGNIQIFPNPTTGELTIKTTQNAYSSFTITNSIGQQMIQQPVTGTQTKVNVSVLPAGLYYITFRGEKGMEVRKFVKS